MRRELQLAPELIRELDQGDIQALALRAGLALNGSTAAAAGLAPKDGGAAQAAAFTLYIAK